MALHSPGRPGYEAGQVIPIFAIVLIALIAIAALVVDQGLLQGQRRYDQNGADAAALAAAHYLGSSADVRNGAGDIYFLANDTSVEDVAFNMALDNQNNKVADAADLVVSLEYARTAGNWCLSPATQARYPGVTFATAPCMLVSVTANGVNFSVPPFPDGNEPYRVSVIVSSTTDPVFFQALQELIDPSHGPNGAPAYCERAPGAGPDGLTTCARAIAVLSGSTEYGGEGPLLPITRGSCELMATVPGTLYRLMGPHDAADCGAHNLNSWKNVMDFSVASYWDDGDDYDYKWEDLDTDPALAPHESPDEWYRDNGGFVPDTSWGFNGDAGHDFLRWAAFGFLGTIVPDNPDHNGDPVLNYDDRDGVKLPTYQNSQPAVGTSLGSLIADGFYCNGHGDAISCPTSVNPSGQYFFSQWRDPSFRGATMLPCNDEFGRMYEDAPKRVGCRDATVAVWADTLEWADKVKSDYTKFVNNFDNPPDRLMPVRFVTMRIYCQEGNTTGVCEEPPGDLVGTSTTSELWGRYSPDLLTGCPAGASCDVAPNINGVWVRLEE